MSRRVTLAVCTLSVVFTVVTLFTLSAIKPSNQNEIDTSWISQLSEYLSRAPPYLPPPSDWDLSNYYVHLFENGEEQLVEYSYDATTIVSYLENLTDRASAKVDKAISQEYLNRITDSDKVVSLTYRFPLLFPSKQLNKAWFILQDNLNEGLTGTIILSQTLDNKEQLSIWAIPK